MNENVELPPGKYYLGDPCYILSRKDYENVVLGQIFGSRGDGSGKFSLRGKEGVVFSTFYGDGAFAFDAGYVCVDSGTIGLIPEGLVGKENKDLLDSAYYPVEFEESFECKRTSDGTMYFGSFSIETKETEINNDWLA